MEWNWHYFAPYEMMCSCGCEQFDMDDGFMAKLEGIRRIFNKPMVVNSAFRCPIYNDIVSVTGFDGPHTTGKAVDIKVCNPDICKLLSIAIDFHMLGFGFKQHGPYESRFLHIDDLSPRVWTYS